MKYTNKFMNYGNIVKLIIDGNSFNSDLQRFPLSKYEIKTKISTEKNSKGIPKRI